MAILLIYDKNNTNLDPIKDQSGCYKRGYVVQVFEDDASCMVPPAPPFLIVKVTGLTKEQAEKYAQPETEVIDVPIDGLHPNGKETIITRRRSFQFLVDNIPVSILNKLKKDRYVEVTFNQVRNYIKNLKTGLTE